MYFPYFRGKQYDYMAIREANSHIYTSGKVIPIIEPIALKQLTPFREIAAKSIPCIIIINPLVGGADSLEIERIIATELNEHPNLVIGFNVTNSTRLPAVRNFLTAYRNHRKAIIFHGEPTNPEVEKLILENKKINWVVFVSGTVSDNFIRSFKAFSRVLVEDSFQKVARNADYPTDSHFSQLYNTYIDRGFQGFGDFLIMPYDYAKGGGPAHAVTLHLTRKHRDALNCKHFVSDDTIGNSNTAGKYEQARLKLVDFLDANPRVDITTGSRAFRSLEFPRLGVAKKRSLLHHMEYIASLI